MLRRDRLVKVLDFGLAKLVEIESEKEGDGLESDKPKQSAYATTPGLVMGTPLYMSPEQARGLPVDARTDIWSLGVVLYQMATGNLPFTGDTTSDVIVGILTTEPPVLTLNLPDVPAELERIVMKALRKSREERYQTVTDLERDLKNLKERLEFEALLKRSGDQSATLELQPTPAPSDVYTASAVGSLLSELRRPKHRVLLALAIIIPAAIAIAYFAYTRYSGSAGAGITSLAVLPQELSNDPAKEYCPMDCESLINASRNGGSEGDRKQFFLSP